MSAGRGGQRPSLGNRGGFTLVELLLVMVIIGVLAEIAIPNYRAITVKARAVDVMGDIDVVAQAARNYQGDNHRWPASTGPGVAPPGLTGYLPDGFSFVGDDFELEWENLDIPGGLPGDPGTTRILGVGVVTDNTELAQALVDVFGQTSWFAVGTEYVRIIERQ